MLFSKEKDFTKYEDKWKKFANLIKEVSQNRGPDRAEKCGYDLFMGLADGTEEERYDAWRRYLSEPKDGSHTDAQRDGVWVPAIAYKES